MKNPEALTFRIPRGLFRPVAGEHVGSKCYELLDSRGVSDFETTCKKVSTGHKENSNKIFTGVSPVSSEPSVLDY